MPVFHYKARSKDGQNLEGDHDAADQYVLARDLRSEGMSVVSIVLKTGSGKKMLNDYIPVFLQPIKLEEKMNFTRNTAVMIGAGLSLAKALEVMSRQVQNPRFKNIVLEIIETIKRGKSFADAIGEHPKVFPKFYQEMVRAGEKSGQLENALKLVAMQLGKDYALKRKVKGAMMYPSIIVCAMIGIGILMLIYVVPTLVSTFAELGTELPTSTKFVIWLSESLAKSGIFFLIGSATFGFLIYKGSHTQRGKYFIDWAFIRAPVVGTINKKFNAARTCRTLSSLISSGVSILEALEITEKVLQNHLYQNVLKSARERIQKGETLAKAFLSDEGLYPPLVGEMVAVGEETGELSHMLLRLAMFYEGEVSAATKDLSTIIEPILMIIIGVVVGFFAISMMSPMYNMVSGM